MRKLIVALLTVAALSLAPATPVVSTIAADAPGVAVLDAPEAEADGYSSATGCSAARRYWSFWGGYTAVDLKVVDNNECDRANVRIRCFSVSMGGYYWTSWWSNHTNHAHYFVQLNCPSGWATGGWEWFPS